MESLTSFIIRQIIAQDVVDKLTNNVFASEGTPLTELQNAHPKNDMAKTADQFYHLGGAIIVGNHWNGSPRKNLHPTRSNAYDFPFMNNPCINLVLDRQNNNFCNKQWDDLWIEKDVNGNKTVLTSFQKYSPFFEPTTTLPTTGLIDGANYHNRSYCLGLPQKRQNQYATKTIPLAVTLQIIHVLF